MIYPKSTWNVEISALSITTFSTFKMVNVYDFKYIQYNFQNSFWAASLKDKPVYLYLTILLLLDPIYNFLME